MSDLLSFCTIQTPLGNMCCGVFNDKLVLLEFENETRVADQLKQLANHLNARPVPEETSLSRKVQEQLNEYFDQKRRSFDLQLLMVGSKFQEKVWESLFDIPYGRTTSYQQQAIKYGDVKAIRAVAKANGENRIGIVIPCHRVIGSDGSLTGYAGELWRKKALLELEGAFAKQASLF
ncbi:MAG: methylated-DNA--[protein]-cysteine S-methyltransferase [Cytophagales bacterium]|nr:methylated-DNA--[protein]-cysteine S-methyltransferase [Cytophagales bacterium]